MGFLSRLEIIYFRNEKKMTDLTDHNFFFSIGQDNTSKMCSVGAVPEIFDGNVTQHSGPFDNVIMGVGC